MFVGLFCVHWCCFIQIELGPMKDRVHDEIVGRFNMCTSFTTANYDTMMRVLDHIDHK